MNRALGLRLASPLPQIHFPTAKANEGNAAVKTISFRISRSRTMLAALLICAQPLALAAQALSVETAEMLPDLSSLPPVYLYRDTNARAYTLQFEATREKMRQKPNSLRRRYLEANDYEFLAARKANIAYLPATDEPRTRNTKAIETCSASPLPTSFTMIGDAHNSYGSIGACADNGRSPGAHTQFLQFVVATFNFRGNTAHVAVPLWFKHSLHGHGVYFGDTSSAPCLNGDDAKFNTRIEAWSQWYGHESDVDKNPYWRSTGVTLNDTCGMPWQDAYYTINKMLVDTGTRYRVTIQADESQSVFYSVDTQVNSGPWVPLTPPVWKNVAYATNWPNDIYGNKAYGLFDPEANGVGLFAIPGALRGSWFVTIDALSTGWF